MRAAKAFGVLAIVSCSLLSACSSSAPTRLGYDGEWSGTTSQGVPITFTISPNEHVTAISVGHDFNGCSGSQTFPSLDLPIATNITCPQGPCPAQMATYRAFYYADSGSALEDRPTTFVYGHFPSMTLASGAVGFRNYPGCGTTYASWTASRR